MNAKRKPRHIWSEADIELLRRNYADSLTRDLAQVIGVSASRVWAKAKELGLKKSVAMIAEQSRQAMLAPDHPGRAYRFQPGIRPWNTGKSVDVGGRSVETRFKPGNRPHTWMPIGSYRVNPEGLLEVKFSDEPGPYYRRWVPVHRKVWIEANGPVPAGHVIAFKPGRRSNKLEDITLDALECLTLAQNMKRNTIHTVMPPELARLAQLKGVLTRAINRRVKESVGAGQATNNEENKP